MRSRESVRLRPGARRGLPRSHGPAEEAVSAPKVNIRSTSAAGRAILCEVVRARSVWTVPCSPTQQRADRLLDRAWFDARSRAGRRRVAASLALARSAGFDRALLARCDEAESLLARSADASLLPRARPALRTRAAAGRTRVGPTRTARHARPRSASAGTNSRRAAVLMRGRRAP